MDQKQKMLIRNILAGIVLLTLILFVLAYCGVFEGPQSDEAQIRALMERSREEVNDGDWDDLFDLCDLTEADKKAWIETVPERANYVEIDSISPRGVLSVPEGVTEYSVDVSVLAHFEKIGISGPKLDSVSGTLYFVKKDGRWLIDWQQSAPTFPYVPNKPNGK